MVGLVSHFQYFFSIAFVPSSTFELLWSNCTFVLKMHRCSLKVLRVGISKSCVAFDEWRFNRNRFQWPFRSYHRSLIYSCRFKALFILSLSADKRSATKRSSIEWLWSQYITDSNRLFGSPLASWRILFLRFSFVKLWWSFMAKKLYTMLHDFCACVTVNSVPVTMGEHLANSGPYISTNFALLFPNQTAFLVGIY